MTLRTRLVLLYTGLAVVVLVLSMLAVYQVTRREALSRLDNSLRSDAALLERNAERAEQHGERGAGERFVNAREAVLSGHMLALVDDHHVLGSAAVIPRLVALVRERGVLDGAAHTVTLSLNGRDFRVSIVPADRGEYAVAAGSLETVSEAEESLLHAILIAGGLGIALTAVGAWFATRRGLRPLESISDLANQVAPDALSLRTGLDKQDEIGAVAAAVDRMLNRLQVAFDSQNRFLEDVSHELRTPLTIARGHLELLENDPVANEAQRREAIDVAIEEIDRVARLVEGLLQLARASEVERLVIERVEIAPLLRDVAGQFSRLGSRQWQVVADEGLSASADADALRQIVLNLARNADEYSPADAPVELSATASGDRDRVRVVVADRGVGIDPRIRGHAFERFAHGGNGIGLGLAISQALAEAQAGAVMLDDRLGGGTIATVELPAAGELSGAGLRTLA